MKIFPFVIFTILAAVLLINFLRKRLMKESPQFQVEGLRPAMIEFPTQIQPNEKLVIIKRADDGELQKVIKAFCDKYNQLQYTILPSLVRISAKESAILFPYDTPFDIFCYFINYLQYPAEWPWAVEILAWANTREDDPWITALSAGKRVMIFIPPDDAEGDNVFMTTADNIGFKLGFAQGEESQLLETPKKSYVSPFYDINHLRTEPAQEFR